MHLTLKGEGDGAPYSPVLGKGEGGAPYSPVLGKGEGGAPYSEGGGGCTLL